MMATIILKRTSQFTALFTRFEVFIDDKKVGTIGNHEEGHYEVAPGPHSLHLKIDTFTSQKVAFQMNPGETIQLTCAPKPLGIGVNIW